MRPAEFVTETETTSDCCLCPNQCRIPEGKLGRCLGRGRKDGQMRVYNYGIVVAAHSDPIEKKPLYHFYPGGSILSVGTFGCNLACRFCQNHEMSQQQVPGEYVAPAELAGQAARIPGNIGVAFTYNEPGIWFEYISDVAPLLRKQGLKVVLVTNGYLQAEPWKRLCALTDAMNIDLKGFTEDFYPKNCSGTLQPILENIAFAVQAGVHVELTNLVVTNKNTDEKPFTEMIHWIEKAAPEMPLHLSRYFPRHLETEPATDPAILDRFLEIASARLPFVYVGNATRAGGNDTLCPKCHTPWIKRQGYTISPVWKKTKCFCGRPIGIPGLAK